MIKRIAAVAVAMIIGIPVTVVMMDEASRPMLKQPCGGWRTYVIDPSTTPVPDAGCHKASFGNFSNGDHYTIYPSGKVRVW